MVSVALLQLANDLLALLAVQVRRQRRVHGVNGAVQRVPGFWHFWSPPSPVECACALILPIGKMATGRTGVVLRTSLRGIRYLSPTRGLTSHTHTEQSVKDYECCLVWR